MIRSLLFLILGLLIVGLYSDHQALPQPLQYKIVKVDDSSHVLRQEGTGEEWTYLR